MQLFSIIYYLFTTIVSWRTSKRCCCFFKCHHLMGIICQCRGFIWGTLLTWMYCLVFCVVWRAAGQTGEGRQSEGKGDSAAPSSRSWLVLQVLLAHCVSPFGFFLLFFCHYSASLLCRSSSQSNKDRNAPSSRLLDSPTFCHCHGGEKKKKKKSLKKKTTLLQPCLQHALLSSAQCDGPPPTPSTKLSDSRFMLSVSILPLNSI